MPASKRRLAWIVLTLSLGAVVAEHSHAGHETRFAERIRTLSGPGGAFDTDNLISNEASYLDVLPALTDNGATGGAYVGVGPDQNFSYIAHIKPAVAFISDVRRDNLLLHLLFKAIFAEAPRRVDYLSLLTGRAPPPPDQQSTGASIETLIEQVDQASPEAPGLVRGRLEDRIRTFGVPLSASDFETIARFHRAFMDAGFTLRFRSHGRPAQSYYPTLGELLAATDRNGRQWGYLASDEAYQVVRELQARDAIIPVVGDVSGPQAMPAIAAAMASEGVTLSALYISNVEDYLFRNGSFEAFADNVARLPHRPQSLIIRSIFGGGSSVSRVQRVDDLLAGIARGRYHSYRDVLYGLR